MNGSGRWLTKGSAQFVSDGGDIRVQRVRSPDLRAFDAAFPTHAHKALRLREADVSAEVSLVGAADVEAESADGFLVYRNALDGAHVLHRPTASSDEDFVYFEREPQRAEVAYEIRLRDGVAGVRLVANAIELLDRHGVPRLRMAPPYLVDAKGDIEALSVSIENCRFDESPRLPWERPLLAPGADACIVHLRWDSRVAYPIVVDPTWSTTGSMNVPRDYHQATMLADGRVLVSGGETSTDDAFVLHSSAEIYDPRVGVWTMTGSMLHERWAHRAVLLPSGLVLAIGGGDNAGYLAAVDIYDPLTGLWTPAANLGIGRANHSAAVLPDGTVLVAGGDGGPSYEEYGTHSTAERYSPLTNTWVGTGSLHQPRTFCSTNLLADGRVLLAGGFQAFYTQSNVTLATSEVYNPSAGTWTVAGSMNVGRWAHATANLQDGRVIAVGGSRSGFVVVNSTETFNPTTGTWTNGPSMSLPRHLSTATSLLDGRVLVAGGYVGTGGIIHTETAEILDSAGTAWAPTASLNVRREFATQNLLRDGRVLITGGWNEDSVTSLASAEVFADPPDCHAGKQVVLAHDHLLTAAELGRAIAGSVNALGIDLTVDGFEWKTGAECAGFGPPEGCRVPQALDETHNRFNAKLDELDTLIAGSGGRYRIARTVQDIRDAKAASGAAIIIGSEGAAQVGYEPASLSPSQRVLAYQQRGWRKASLRYPDPPGPDSPLWIGGGPDLSPTGVEVLRAMNSYGVLVDVQDLDRAAAELVYDIASAPLILSHHGPTGSVGRWTNQDLRNVAASGGGYGVIALSFVSNQYAEHPSTTAADVAEQLETLVSVVGEDHVAYGGDYMPPDYSKGPFTYAPTSIANLADVTRALLTRGISQQVVDKIIGENMLTLYQRAWDPTHGYAGGPARFYSCTNGSTDPACVATRLHEGEGDFNHRPVSCLSAGTSGPTALKISYANDKWMYWSTNGQKYECIDGTLLAVSFNEGSPNAELAQCSDSATDATCVAAAASSGSGTSDARAVSCLSGAVAGPTALRLRHLQGWKYDDVNLQPQPCSDGSALAVRWGSNVAIPSAQVQLCDDKVQNATCQSAASNGGSGSGTIRPISCWHSRPSTVSHGAVALRVAYEGTPGQGRWVYYNSLNTTEPCVEGSVLVFGASNPVDTTPRISTDKRSYAFGETITVSYLNRSNSDADWVAFLPPTNEDGEVSWWEYLPLPRSGTLTNNTLPAGTFVVKMYFNDEFIPVATSETFTVGNPPASSVVLTTDKNAYDGLENVVVSFSGMSGASGDWIGAYWPFADMHYQSGWSPTAWGYTTGTSSGTITLSGLSYGPHNVRAFFGNYVQRGQSVGTFMVSAAVAPTKSSFSITEPVVIRYGGMAYEDVSPTSTSYPYPYRDWISVALPTSPDATFVVRQYTDGLASGTLTFPAGSIALGTYVARAYFDDELVKRTQSTVFTITP